MHSFVVKIVSHMLVLTSFAISIGVRLLGNAIIFYRHHGLSPALVIHLHSSKLVNLFTFFVCVWEGHVLHLVSHLFKTMLMLTSHPYISLLKCFDMTHTHRFGCAYY